MFKRLLGSRVDSAGERGPVFNSREKKTHARRAHTHTAGKKINERNTRGGDEGGFSKDTFWRGGRDEDLAALNLRLHGHVNCKNGYWKKMNSGISKFYCKEELAGITRGCFVFCLYFVHP